jgi:hypothetical protein
MYFMPGMQPFMQQHQQHGIPDIVVPARVNKALEFFSMVTHKTATRAVANDLAIEQIPGQKLTDEEANAMATACNLLSRYFSGTLPPDIWEEIRIRAVHRRPDGDSKIMNCPVCVQNGQIDSMCSTCGGSGKIMITGMGSMKNDGANNAAGTR